MTQARTTSGQPFVVRIGSDFEQLIDTLASDRRDDPERGKMSTDRIDHGGLLADKEMARAMQHQATLLLGGLGLDKPHVGPGDCFADRLGIGGIVLMAFDIRLHIGRRHQARGMAERLELARPMMRRGAGLNTHEAGLQLLEERQDVAALQLTADDHLAFRVDAVHGAN